MYNVLVACWLYKAQGTCTCMTNTGVHNYNDACTYNVCVHVHVRVMSYIPPLQRPSQMLSKVLGLQMTKRLEPYFLQLLRCFLDPELLVRSGSANEEPSDPLYSLFCPPTNIAEGRLSLVAALTLVAVYMYNCTMYVQVYTCIYVYIVV